MDVNAYATFPTTLIRRAPVLMNSCVLFQLVKQTFTVSISFNQNITLKNEPVLERKSLSFSNFFLALLMLR